MSARLFVFVFFGFISTEAVWAQQRLDSLDQESVINEALLVLMPDQRLFAVYERGFLLRQGSIIAIGLGCSGLRSLDLRHKWQPSLVDSSGSCWLRLSYAKYLEIKVSELEAKWLYNWLDPAKVTIKIAVADKNDQRMVTQ